MKKIVIILVLLLFSYCSKFNKIYNISTFISSPIQNREIMENIHDQDCIGFVNQNFSHNSLNISDFDDLEILKKKTGLDWQKIEQYTPYLNFKEYFDSCDNKVVHVIDIVNSPKDKKNMISIGSDDGFSLWVNGDSITTVLKGRGLTPDDDIIQVNFKKGKNIVLYKIENGNGAWEFHRLYSYSKKELKKIKNRIYADVLESHIIPDTTNYIYIKKRKQIQQKTLSEFTQLDTVQFAWYELSDVDFKSPLKIDDFPQLPEKIKIPESSEKEFILKVSRLKNNKDIYQELLPVFSESKVLHYLDNLYYTDSQNSDPIYLARKVAVGIVFGLSEIEERCEREYSTRMQTQILYDLYLTMNFPENYWINFPGPKIIGYRSPTDSSIQIYRLHIPNKYINNEALPSLTIKIPYKRESKTCGFLPGIGQSHYYMANWSRLSNQYNTIFVKPFGRGTENFQNLAAEEVPIIFNQIKKYWKFDESKVIFWTGSSGMRITFDIMCNMDFKIKYFCGMCISPGKDLDNWNIALHYLKNIYPDIEFFVRNGIKDDLAPIEDVRNWKKQVKKIHIKIDYRELPNNSHLLDFISLSEDFYESIR
ncbi:MAG: hypothetical protein JXQ65_11935 [Candidatus Marinimicrobia bacterium]|nr:hypothetical protein [Candidatus Neomarinimicrobiota bacterium]